MEKKKTKQPSLKSSVENENAATLPEGYEIEMPKVFEEPKKRVETPKVFAPNEEIERPEPENPTLRKVEVLSNLANACRNKEVIRAISSLPDGKVILNIFVSAMQQKIDQIMSGQVESQVLTGMDEINNNMSILGDSMISVNGLAMKMQEFFVHLHKSPLVDVLKTLAENLTNMPKPNPNPYFQAQAGVNPSPPATQVTPQYESQIEQTPKFTKQRSESAAAPTSPPRDSGILSW